MIIASISQLKINPSSIITQASDYPVAVENRNKVQAYVVGKALFEKIITFIENQEDMHAVKAADFSKGRDFEKFASELGL